ncbi:MAG TPA: cysteine rich repeat-containing protein [Steroidobacteraceae bacterium]|nr:cysteine rich repeat-containing protein [Steroidobacteraceae bacterium]
MRRFTSVVIGLLTLAGAATQLAAQQLTDAQRSAIKSACRGDYQRVCANVPPGTKDSLQCLVQHSAQVSSGCRDALAPAAASAGTAPASTGAASAAAPAAGAAPAAPAAAAASASASAPPANQLSPREEARVLRSQCGADFQKFCSSVQLGGGHGVACLREHAADLTPGCRTALTSAAH